MKFRRKFPEKSGMKKWTIEKFHLVRRYALALLRHATVARVGGLCDRRPIRWRRMNRGHVEAALWLAGWERPGDDAVHSLLVGQQHARRGVVELCALDGSVSVGDPLRLDTPIILHEAFDRAAKVASHP